MDPYKIRAGKTVLEEIFAFELRPIVGCDAMRFAIAGIGTCYSGAVQVLF